MTRKLLLVNASNWGGDQYNIAISRENGFTQAVEMKPGDTFDLEGVQGIDLNALAIERVEVPEDNDGYEPYRVSVERAES